MKKRIIPLIFPLFFILNSILVINGDANSNRTEICNLSIMITKAQNFDELHEFLQYLDFHNWTIVIASIAYDYIFGNSTRVSILTNYGDLIPYLAYLQSKTPEERISTIDFHLDVWETNLGYRPSGFFCFMPDTYTVNYLYSLNISFMQGYCFDQYVVDYMTERGGWPAPYYSHPFHVLMPNNLHPKGVVIFPHNTLDWVAAFTDSYQYGVHPLAVMGRFNNEEEQKNYFLNLILETERRLQPFGYVSVQFEWNWCFQHNTTDTIKDWIKTLLSYSEINFWTYKTTAEWFKNNYEYTPSYYIEFCSPYNGKVIEWYYCLDFRVARIDNKVVSYVDYTEQQNDKYLTTYTQLDFSEPASTSNCMDNSLSFEIDALGGGICTHPITTSSYSYIGNLQDFPLYYDVKHNLLEKQLPFILLTLGIISVLGYTILKKVS